MPEPAAADVILLTAEDCALCEHAKEILTRLADEYGLSIRTCPLASGEGRALAEQHRVLFAPGVLLDGRLFSYGRLSERKLRRELARQRTAAAAPGERVGLDQGS